MPIQLPIKNDPAIDALFRDKRRFKLLKKGRRVGVTRSKANDWISLTLFSDEELKFLWVDTIQRNIDRYYERFFWKPLRSVPRNLWDWNGHRKTLRIRDSLIDFGSAERPENLEGFGYDDMFLNEAGIILQGDSGRKLWEEIVRPMLSDRNGSALIAGVPKGQRNNYFSTLWQSTQNRPDWGHFTLTSYDSPYIEYEEVKAMEQDMHPATARQEIWAEFVDYTLTDMPWLSNFNDEHLADISFDPSKPMVLSFDFNIDPMVVTCHHIGFWDGAHHWHTFDEIVLSNGSVPAMVEKIKERFPPLVLSQCLITGDQTGNKRDINQIDHISSWKLVKDGLRVSDGRFRVPSINPKVASNRELCNFILYSHPDVKISHKCKTLIFEARYTESASDGTIPKKNRNKMEQRADAIDTWRYVANAFMGDYIDNPGKYRR